MLIFSLFLPKIKQNRLIFTQKPHIFMSVKDLLIDKWEKKQYKSITNPYYVSKLQVSDSISLSDCY